MKTQLAIYSLILLFIPTIAHAESWVLWKYSEYTSVKPGDHFEKKEWLALDAFETLSACKVAAEKSLANLSKLHKVGAVPLNAGWELPADDGTRTNMLITYKGLCLPSATNPSGSVTVQK